MNPQPPLQFSLARTPARVRTIKEPKESKVTREDKDKGRASEDAVAEVAKTKMPTKEIREIKEV